MSGTSLDGLDICYVQFSQQSEGWKYKIIKATTVEYSQEWEEKLRNAIALSSEDLLALHSEYGFYLGEKIEQFIDENNIQKISVIASHGHTIFHQPERKFTCQIGDGRAIKIINPYPIVYDFRSQDVLLGGNGAPLVPIGDELLFSEFDACINLGGFSNISFKKEGYRIAFDICPVNSILNDFAKKLGKNFDQNGDFAREGYTNNAVLEKLNNLPYYKMNSPKSLGIEWVKAEVSPLLSELEPKEVLATVTHHAAIQISQTIQQYGLQNILLTGGGAYNSFLVELIQQKIKGKIHLPSPEIIEYKEALIFALMGVLRLTEQDNVLCSATGSLHNHCTGILV